MTYDSDLHTLTCISTGGPATTVTWTRDSTTVTEGTETVLDNPVTAQYTHTLTVTAAGVYNCTVSNNRPSSDSASTTVPGIPLTNCTEVVMMQITGTEAPTGVTAVQCGPTSILVSWNPSSNSTVYIIHYDSSGGGSSGSETVSGGDTNNHTLNDLTNGETYIISIVATSNILPSETVTVDMAVPLGECYIILQ